MLKRLLLTLAIIIGLAPAVASAQGYRLRMVGHATIVAGCTAYANDNGCSGANTYVLGCPTGYSQAVGSVPAFNCTGAQLAASMTYSSNVYQYAYDTADSQQLPTTAAPTGVEAQLRNSHFHANNQNFPYIDYATGPSVWTTLEPMDQYYDPTGQCVYYSNLAASFGTSGYTIIGPGIGCQLTITGTTPTVVPIHGVDLTRISTDSTTGVRTGQILIKGNNNYINTNVTLDIANVKGCACDTAAHTTGGGAAFITADTGGNTTFTNINIKNYAFDGQYRLRGNDTEAIWKTVIDDRRGQLPGGSAGGSNPVPTQVSLSMLYGVVTDTGHDVIVGGGSTGNFIYDYNAADGICEARQDLCHNEVAEIHTNIGDNVPVPETDYIGNIVRNKATYINTDNTSPIYDSGAFNGVSYVNFKIQNNLFIQGYHNCSGSQSTVYSPTNPCTTGGAIGGASISYATGYSTQNMYIQGNVVDSTGNMNQSTGISVCFNNAVNQWSGSSISGNVATQLVGNNSLYGINGYMFPGPTVYDVQGALTGFVPATISAGTSNAFATFQGTIVSGVLTTVSPQSMTIGSTLYDVFGNSLGTVTSRTSSTVWNINITGYTPAANSYFQNINTTTSAVPGTNPGAGTFILSQSEPYVADTAALGPDGKNPELGWYGTIVNIYTKTSGTTGANDNWNMGGFWGSAGAGGDPGARLIDASVQKQPGFHNCA